MKRDDMNYAELVDWIAGTLLTELIKGEFRSAVWLALNQAIMWNAAQEKKNANRTTKTRSKNKTQIHNASRRNS